jgi:tetratricopeptide (TPR) repeat protein
MDDSTLKPMDPEEIERILRNVHILQNRGKSAEAIAHLKDLVEQYPEEPAFWEVYGDLLADVEQFEEAKDAYFKSKEIKKPRLNAERKYADMVYRISMKDMPLLSEDPPANPSAALMLSLLAPGAGQYYNKQVTKAIVFFAIWVVAMIPMMLIWGDVGSNRIGGSGTQIAMKSILSALTNGPGIVLLILILFVVVYAATDAYLTAKQANKDFGPIFTIKTAPPIPDLSTFQPPIKEEKPKSDS